jgi:hypothetical protein
VRLPLLLVAAVLALAFNLGGYPLFDPDEGRNAEVAREMAESNDYRLPHLNGLPYLDKPVVYFAAAAAVMEILGPTETAARLPPSFTLGTIAVVVRFDGGERIPAGLPASHSRRCRWCWRTRTTIFGSASPASTMPSSRSGGPAGSRQAAMGFGAITKGLAL